MTAAHEILFSTNNTGIQYGEGHQIMREANGCHPGPVTMVWTAREGDTYAETGKMRPETLTLPGTALGDGFVLCNTMATGQGLHDYSGHVYFTDRYGPDFRKKMATPPSSEDFANPSFYKRVDIRVLEYHQEKVGVENVKGEKRDVVRAEKVIYHLHTCVNNIEPFIGLLGLEQSLEEASEPQLCSGIPLGREQLATSSLLSAARKSLEQVARSASAVPFLWFPVRTVVSVLSDDPNQVSATLTFPHWTSDRLQVVKQTLRGSTKDREVTDWDNNTSLGFFFPDFG